MAFISQSAAVDAKAFVHATASIYGPGTVGPQSVIEHQCLLGHPQQAALDGVLSVIDAGGLSLDEVFERAVRSGVAVSTGCIVRTAAVLYDGVRVGAHAEIGHSSIVREGSAIGDYSRTLPFTSVGREVAVGNGCRIGGLLCNGSEVGRYVTTLGLLVHEYHASVTGQVEAAPTVHDGATIGRNAVIVGDVSIGEFAYVGAGAVVLTSVDPAAVVAGNPARLLKRREDVEIEEIRRRMDAGRWL